MKIAFTMIHYPVAMGRYFLEALLRREDVELWTAGPFTGRWIPWAGGMHLPESYVRAPDFALPFGGGTPSLPYEIVENRCPFKPDLWLEVNAGMSPTGRPSGLYAVVGTDPHVLNYDRVRRGADYFFCMQRPYAKPGDHWLPYAYDPVYHSPSPKKVGERKHDAALIGLPYEQRTKLVQALRAQGRDVFYELGPAYGDARDVYHDTKVGLNWSSLQDTTARCFELMAMATVPVLNRVPDLMSMFKDGEDFLGFDTMDEAVAHVTWAIENPEDAEQLGRQAMNAVNEHTWAHRVDAILQTTGVV
jgi:hypothetical protein